MATPTYYFDTLYPDHIQGIIDSPVVTDPDGTPNHVLELEKAWSVEIKWRLTSDSSTMYPVTAIDGTWHIQVSLESLGKGFEDTVAQADVPFYPPDFGSNAMCEWSHKFTIAAGIPPDEAVYKLVTLITFKDHAGNRKAMAGFMDHPLLTFYKSA